MREEPRRTAFYKLIGINTGGALMLSFAPNPLFFWGLAALGVFNVGYVVLHRTGRRRISSDEPSILNLRWRILRLQKQKRGDSEE